jgi:hypothetical protein
MASPQEKIVVLMEEILKEVKQLEVEDNNKPTTSPNNKTNSNFVFVDDFKSSTVAGKIQAAIDYAHKGNIKTVLLADSDYYISEGIVIKQGVKLLGSYGSKVTIGANVRGFEIEKDASLDGVAIRVDHKGYDKEVIYLDGKHKYYNTWNQSSIRNLLLVNWTGKVSGTGIHCYSGGEAHEISFIDFESIKIVGFEKGIHLKADKPNKGMAWVNANRFDKFSIEDCVEMIVLEGSETIPNECSGNSFTNLQLQPSRNTRSVLTVQGQYNKFDGICWDMHLVKHRNPVVTFDAQSDYNELNMRSVQKNRIDNRGKKNNLFDTNL